MKRSEFSILFAALASMTLAIGAAAQVYPCASHGAACRDPIPDPSSEGYSAALTSTITVPAGVCSAASPVGSVGISFRILHDDIRDLGAIAVTSPTGVSIPLAPASQGGEDYDYTAPCGTAVVWGSPPSEYFPASVGTIIYSTAVSGASSASGTWTMQLLDTRHGAYGALDDWTLDVSCGIPGVTLTTVSSTAIEGYGSPAVVTVSRSPVTAHPVRIYLTVAGTATSGADYAGVTFPIELCGGVASRDIPFAAILDALAEGSETVELSVSANAGYAGAGVTSATLTLLDQIVPTFTSPATAPFTIGTAGTFAVTVTAIPAATVTSWTGTPPAGVNVVLNGDGTATISGTPALGTAGSYTLEFTATRPIPPAVTQVVTILVGKAPQTIAFAQPPAAPAVLPMTLDATASSGLAVSFTSQTPDICSVTGTTATARAVGTCTIAANQPGDDSWLPAPQVVRSFTVMPLTSYSGPTSTGSGIATASFTGGTPTCTLSLASFASPPAAPPSPFYFPHGGFAFALTGCTPGSRLSFVFAQPAPAPPGTLVWSFVSGEWLLVPSEPIGNDVPFTIDIGPDGTAAGYAAPAVLDPAAIPTLDFGMLVLLALALALVAMRTMSRS